MTSGANPPLISIVLNVMGRVELAEYGFRSWMFQETPHPYEVVLNLFNDQKPKFEKLAESRADNCSLTINTYERPAFFNISVANNLGILNAHPGSNWLFFTAADMIYSADSINVLKREAIDRGILYCVGTRRELNAQQTQSLKRASEYTAQNNFAFLSHMQDKTDVFFRGFGYGWFFRRDVIRNIGGFDREVIVAEDKDIQDRAMHYLRRTDLQHSGHGVGVFAYHLDHPVSELFLATGPVMPMLRARNARLLADPNSTEDIVPSHLDSREKLADDLRNTKPPAVGERYRHDTMKKVFGRFRRAFQALRGAEIK